MRVLLTPLGSAGDVHPYVGLALALRGRGHDVTLATSAYFRPLIARLGLRLVPLGTVDRPREQRRDTLTVDLSGAAGHVAVVGGPRSGKATLLRTILASASLVKSSDQRWLAATGHQAPSRPSRGIFLRLVRRSQSRSSR